MANYVPIVSLNPPNFCACGHDWNSHVLPTSFNNGTCRECQNGSQQGGSGNVNHGFVPVLQLNDRFNAQPTRQQFGRSNYVGYYISATSNTFANPAPPGFGPERPPNGQRGG